MVQHRVAWGVLALTLLLFVVGDLYAGAVPAGTTASNDPQVNTSEIATAVHAEINNARRANGVAPLTYDAALASTADDHTAWMADTQQLNHSERDTYACAYAGENIAYTYANGDVRVNDTTVVNLNNNETRIADRLVTGWLRSPPHRENILDPRFSAEGIGIATVAVDGRERVYATQALCG